jgi:hypothetical protein
MSWLAALQSQKARIKEILIFLFLKEARIEENRRALS